MVFQNPYGSLNPRKKVGSILEEPLIINTDFDAEKRQATGRAMLAKVGLRPEQYARYPHMFSGGQRQRIAIARALMLHPRIVVADEPVSALDVSIRAQVLNLLMDLQDEFKLAYLFISHDLSVVRHIADEVMVMYLGRPAEQGDKDGHLRAAAPSLYQGAAGQHALHRSHGPLPAGLGARRAALAHQSAQRLRLPQPLPLCRRRLHDQAAGAAARGWASGRLPLRGIDRLGPATETFLQQALQAGASCRGYAGKE